MNHQAHKRTTNIVRREAHCLLCCFALSKVPAHLEPSSDGVRRNTERQHEAAGVDVDAGDNVDDDDSRLHHLQAHHCVGEDGRAHEDLQHRTKR